MTDRMTSEQRSRAMAAVRSRGNASTELVLARLLRKSGIHGWKRHQAIFGRPDFVFAKGKVAVFVDGCFWHGCKKHRSIPKTNKKFWSKKIQGNKERDKRVAGTLRRRGWKVIRIWEHQLKGKKTGVPKRIINIATIKH